MPGSSGDKLCPICDSPLQPGSRKCGFCGTDLTIFDMEVEKSEPAQSEPSTPQSRPTIESRVEEVMTAQPKPEPVPEPSLEPVEAPVPTAAVSVPEERPEVEEEQPTEEVSAESAGPAEAQEYFACPECGSQVETHASTCPGCGVMFAEEGAEMFQCPACNTLVSIDSKTCPGCGAVFVESEEEATSHAQQPQPQPEIEAPISEVKPPPARPVPTVVEEPEPEPAEALEPESVPEAEDDGIGRKAKSAFGWLKRRKKDSSDQDDSSAVSPGLAAPEEPRRIPEPELEERAPKAAPSHPKAAPGAPGAKDRGKDLARMVAEMKPLLALANEKDIDIAESKRLIDEAAEAGRDRQLEKALEYVNKSRSILMGKIDDHLAASITQLREETNVAKNLGGDVSRAMTYLREIERARGAGDAEAAFVYVEKVSNELLPITGRYKEAKNRTVALRSLVADCEALILDTKEARTALVEANKAFEASDFDRVEMLVKQATDRLYRSIPDRINEEMHSAKSLLIEAKMKNVNTAPMITILKSVRTLMKAGDYQQALREMKEFKEQMRRVT